MTGGKGQDLTFSLPISFGNTPALYPCFLPLASICLRFNGTESCHLFGVEPYNKGGGEIEEVGNITSQGRPHNLFNRHKETEKCSN
jgi:hypothetical protein